MAKENKFPWYPDQVSSLIKRYKQWAVTNPQSLVEMEGCVKLGSYLLAGRFVQSNLVCEVVYSMSRLFELFNDCLIQGKLPHLSFKQENRIKLLLCVLENVEVVMEIGASQIWGETARWAVITAIHVIKTIWRFVLVLRDKVHLLPAPAMSPINRDLQQHLTQHTNGGTTLPSSGRLLPPLHSAPAPHQRQFTVTRSHTEQHTQHRTQKQLVAEVLHVLRPMTHLGSLYVWGRKSWLPYLIAMGMDLSSLHLHQGALLSPSERMELTRRHYGILLYVIRCPAYHRLTEAQLQTVLRGVGSTVPFSNKLCNSILHYINYWHWVYSHSWNL